MARKSDNASVDGAFTETSKLALNEYTAKARELGNTLSDGGVQMQIAIMGFVGSQKATKAKKPFDFNAAVFCPFAGNYYGPGKGGKREKLEGFSPDGKHVAGKSAATQLRAYQKFVKAGTLPVDAKPIVVAIMSEQRIGSLSMGAKGKLLEEIIAKGEGGKLPPATVVTEMIEAEIPSRSKSVNAVKAIKGLASSADRIAKQPKFWTAMGKLNNAKAAKALAHAMHFLALARAAVDTSKASTEKNLALNGFVEKHAAAEYKLAVKTGASIN